MPKIGLFGGTFDPVHNGHIQLAEAAINEAGLDRILMVPAVVPPHKKESSIASYKHRVEMVRLALIGHPGIELSLIESELPTPSYTIDTVNLLQSRLPSGSEIFFIIGIDAFLEITSWKSYNELLDKISLLVAMRHGFSQQLLDGIRRKLAYIEGGSRWTHPGERKDIFFLASPIIDISSSLIRQRLNNGELIGQGIPDSVLHYMAINRLYTC